MKAGATNDEVSEYGNQRLNGIKAYRAKDQVAVQKYGIYAITKTSSKENRKAK